MYIGVIYTIYIIRPQRRRRYNCLIFVRRRPPSFGSSVILVAVTPVGVIRVGLSSIIFANGRRVALFRRIHIYIYIYFYTHY